MAEIENSEASTRPSAHLNDLPDDLLAEVLCRVDTAKSATRYKLVSKGWYYLISSSYFAARFVSCHAKDNNNNSYGSGGGYALIMSYVNLEHIYKIESPYEVSKSMLNPHELSLLYYIPEGSGSMLNPRELSLNYLPEECGKVFIVASCNDLLLCWAKKESHNAYYICNPITMQWIGVSSPTATETRLQSAEPPPQFALVCKPCHYHVSDGECSITNVGYQFVIVRMNKVGTGFGAGGIMVETHFSGTGKWRTSYLMDSKYGFPRKLVYWNSKLHWVAGGVAIVAYDPFNNEETRLIDASELELCPQEPLDAEFHLAVSQDCLRCIRFCSNMGNAMENANNATLSIWELKDYKMGKWSLEHRICMCTMARGNSWLNKFLHCRVLPVLILGCHPTNKDIVCLILSPRAVLCNLKSRELKLFAEVPRFYTTYTDHGALSLALPCWPTPLSPPVLRNAYQ